MAEERKPTAEVHQSVEITQTISRTRKHVRNQQTNRNYGLLQSGKEILIRNYNGFKQIINHNYRRFSY